MMTSTEPKWELWGGETYRMPVPGGWLYRRQHSEVMTFVPEQEVITIDGDLSDCISNVTPTETSFLSSL